jgi:hypothetical protein
MKKFKKKLLEYCIATLRRKIELLSFTIDELTESMNADTKSSVGDKHETSRARMQAEQEKLQSQMADFKEQLMQLEKMDLKRVYEEIATGCLIQTPQAYFFICVPMGKLEFEGKVIYVISPLSPIAKKFMGLKARDELKVNEINYSIMGIC